MGSRLDTTPAVTVKESSGAAQAEQCPTQTEVKNGEIGDDQAEQSQAQIRCKPMVCGDQAEPYLTAANDDPEATLSRGQAEHDGSPGSSYTQNTRQSHTIKWAVARYVSSPVVNSINHVLIDKHVGTAPTDHQAEPPAVWMQLPELNSAYHRQNPTLKKTKLTNTSHPREYKTPH